MGDTNLDSLVVGDSTVSIKEVAYGTVALNPASLATATRAAETVTVTGAEVGDLIVMYPPATLNDDLIFCGAAVTADDTVTIYLYNPTGGAIDDTEKSWTYVWVDLT